MSVFHGIDQHFRCRDVDRLQDGKRLHTFGHVDATVGQDGLHGATGGGGKGGHSRQVGFESRLLQRLHAETVHPVGGGFKVRAFLQVHRHVERLTGEQIDAEAHVFALTDFAAHVDREGMNKVVDNAPEVDQITEEERESFDAFLFAKSRQFKPVRVHIRRQGERDVGRERVKVHLAVEAQEGVVVGGLVLKRNAERRRCPPNQSNLGVPLWTR